MRNSILRPGKWLIAALAALGLVILGPWNGTGIGAENNVSQTWRSMHSAEVRIEKSDSDTRHLPVRVADDSAERAQGMQHLPAHIVRDNPIWFVFPEPRRVGWHMRNVRVALDIAYVDETGRVIEVERMTPDSSGYGIDAPIAAALEVAAGQAKRLGIERGTRLMLQGD